MKTPYVYEAVEKTRRQASRTMLEMARKGVTDTDGFRRDLMLHLQVSVKFTFDLEALVESADPLAWKELVERVASPDEFHELHGACSRVLESYPSNPGLLCISAITRISPSEEGQRLSQEEFRAALKYVQESSGTAQASEIGNVVASLSEEVEGICKALHTTFGIWLLQNGREREAVLRFFHEQRVRHAWLADVLSKVEEDLPTIGGL